MAKHPPGSLTVGSAQMGPLLALFCQKRFCLSFTLATFPNAPLFAGSGARRAPGRGWRKKRPYAGRTCVGNVINENKFPTLEALQEILTLKAAIHYALSGVTGLTGDFVFYLKCMGNLRRVLSVESDMLSSF